MAVPATPLHAPVSRWWLYAIGLTDSRIKVGRTSDPQSRLATHRSLQFRNQIEWVHLGPAFTGSLYEACSLELDTFDALSERCERAGRTEVFLTGDRMLVLTTMREVARRHAQRRAGGSRDASGATLWYVLQRVGGASALAALLGEPVKRQNVEHWARANKLPSEHCPAIERELGFPCEDLRGDLRWVRVPDEAWSAGKPLLDVAAKPFATAIEG